MDVPSTPYSQDPPSEAPVSYASALGEEVSGEVDLHAETLDAAREYCRLGFAPVPVPLRAKRPSLKDWQRLRLGEQDVHQHFNGRPSNIGLLCGEPSGNYVDVDLDCPEAIALAPLFLPRTHMLHGHKSRPRSHWGYRCPVLPPAQQFTDVGSEGGRGSVLLELHSGVRSSLFVVRSSWPANGGVLSDGRGPDRLQFTAQSPPPTANTEARTTNDEQRTTSPRQIIVPPSVHESGEPIRWAEGCRPEPELVEGPILADAVAQLAAATLLARHWPVKGGRNLASLALAGWLLRHGIWHETVALLIEAAARGAGDEQAGERAACVPRTQQRLAGGEEVYGAPTLAEVLQGNAEAVVEKVGEWMGVGCQLSAISYQLSAAGRAQDAPTGGLAAGTELKTQSSKLKTQDWPTPPDPEAFAGLAGRAVELVGRHSEADPVAVLGHFLAAFGVAVGPGPHCLVGATVHTARENVVIVGQTARARKGESASHTRALLSLADPEWEEHGIASGLSSGEGLIFAVRDPVYRLEPKKGTGGEMEYERVMVDAGVADKRLLALEPEMARVLQSMRRQSNTLSAIVREAYDTGKLRIMTKGSATSVTGAHIGIIGHITVEELRRELTGTEMVNGFANRFLWLAVRRSKLLPEPSPMAGQEVIVLAGELREALEAARRRTLITRDDAAARLWREVYPMLETEREGMVGAILARGAAHVLRLSLIYALLDRAPQIGETHLRSALALWGYVERCAEHIFGESTGDPLAERIRHMLAAAGELTRMQINNLLGRHQTAERIEAALTALAATNQVMVRRESTRGRPIEIWSVAP